MDRAKSLSLGSTAMLGLGRDFPSLKKCNVILVLTSEHPGWGGRYFDLLQVVGQKLKNISPNGGLLVV